MRRAAEREESAAMQVVAGVRSSLSVEREDLRCRGQRRAPKDAAVDADP